MSKEGKIRKMGLRRNCEERTDMVMVMIVFLKVGKKISIDGFTRSTQTPTFHIEIRFPSCLVCLYVLTESVKEKVFLKIL